MLLASTLLLVCQGLELEPTVGHPAEELVVRVTGSEGKPTAGVPVEVRTPSGELRKLGPSDRRGEVIYVPDDVGVYEFRARLTAGPLVVLTLHVVARPQRWLHAVLWTPLGLLLVWANLRRWRCGGSPRAETKTEPQT